MKKIFLLILFLVGTIFSVNAQFNTLLDFAGTSNGSRPEGSLISDGTFLYGMTSWGGMNDSGVVFKIMPDGSGYSKLLDFTGTNGARPSSDLFYDGTFLYGVTYVGGANDSGVVFKIMPDGSGYSKLMDFDGVATGSYPVGAFVSDGTFLYGMTYRGGTNGFGTIYKIKKDGTGFLKLFDFNGTNGHQPYGSLFFDGTFLYGTTNLGGIYSLGVIFKIKTDGTGFSKLLDFGGTNGRNPQGTLISDGTYLYGMTAYGGTSASCLVGCGVIFKIKTNGTSFSKLLDFSDSLTGSFPSGSLVSDGTFLYGMTYGGGTNSVGAIFKILPNGNNYSKLFSFAVDTNGYHPFGSLLYDGTFFYGMTFFGGTSYDGTIFKFKESPAGINENNSQNIFSLYPNPSNGIFTLSSEITTGEISIFNLLGENIYQSQIVNRQLKINLFDQPNGIYFVTIKNEKESFTQKIIIEK